MAIKQLEPYVSEPKQDDPYVELVPVNKMDIGANAQGMPKAVRSNNMSLQHVGGAVTGGSPGNR